MVSNTKLNRADVIVVLGYPSEPDGTPSQTMRFRVEKGAELYHQGCAPFIVFSGGAVDQAFIEAKVMASYAITLGVPKDAIILETESRDTLENASLVSAILTSRGWKSIILVTSPYHTRRATKLFERLGYSVTSVVSNSPTETSTRTRLSEILHEYFLWIYYKFVHAI